MPTTDFLRDPTYGLADDLREDLETRWVPDVVADCDLAAQFTRTEMTQRDISFVDVPKAGGGFRHAPLLSGAALGILRRAVHSLRERSETFLDPAVCGYRIGASGATTYSDEYRRFRSWSEAMANDYPWVVIADVSSFFESIDDPRVHAAMRGSLGVDWEPVADVLSEFRALGVDGLPAGYGDARLIANLVLSYVDTGVDAPFTRWVDDYRLFASSETEGHALLGCLQAKLSELGLQLNEDKCSVVSSTQFLRRRMGMPLDSVYHPQDEDVATVRANLRSVLLKAIDADDRRLLRFALPRLGAQDDPFAVDFVLHQLRQGTVDAPRMVAYLGEFLEAREVVAGVQALASAPTTDPWTLARLGPLLCRMPLQETTLAHLAVMLHETSVPALWGTLLRVLSTHGCGDLVNAALTDPSAVLDARSAIAACLDLGQEVPEQIRRLDRSAAQSLERLGRVPLPPVESLL